MPTAEQMNRIAELTAQIAELPKGYISQKTIGGKMYFYHQWSEQGQKQSKYLHDSEIEPLTKQIELRKRLQAELRELRTGRKSMQSEVAQMKCVLMHKTIPVAQIELDDVSGFIQKIDAVYAPEHLPVGVPIRQGRVDRAGLNDWWTERSIPASRSGVRRRMRCEPACSMTRSVASLCCLALSVEATSSPLNKSTRWRLNTACRSIPVRVYAMSGW